MQEPQQRPQPGDHALRRADAATLRFVKYERDHGRAVQPLQRQYAHGLLPPREEHASDADIVAHGRSDKPRHSSRYAEYRSISTSLAVTASRRPRGHDPQPAQILEQRTIATRHNRKRPDARRSARNSSSQTRSDRRSQTTPRQPAADIRQQPQVSPTAPDRYPCRATPQTLARTLPAAPEPGPVNHDRLPSG